MNPDTPSPDELEAELDSWIHSAPAQRIREALAASPVLPGEASIANRVRQQRSQDHSCAEAALLQQLRRWRLATLLAVGAALCALLLLLLQSPREVPSAPPDELITSPTLAKTSSDRNPQVVTTTQKPARVLPSHGVSDLRQRMAATRTNLNNLRKRARPLSTLHTQTPKTKTSL